MMSITIESLERLVTDFETGHLEQSVWNHGAHLSVAGWYVFTFGRAEAVKRLRTGILHLNGAHGVPNTPERGYHETLTVFWVAIVDEFLRRASGSFSTSLAALLENYSERRDLWREYYSFDVLRSREARARWIAPDRRTLPV